VSLAPRFDFQVAQTLLSCRFSKTHASQLLNPFQRVAQFDQAQGVCLISQMEWHGTGLHPCKLKNIDTKEGKTTTGHLKII
jgi:hypothetical protein